MKFQLFGFESSKTVFYQVIKDIYILLQFLCMCERAHACVCN